MKTMTILVASLILALPLSAQSRTASGAPAQPTVTPGSPAQSSPDRVSPGPRAPRGKAMMGGIPRLAMRAGRSTGSQDPEFAKLLESALAGSPEVRLARARVAEAEAQLALARMKVTQELFVLHAEKTRLEGQLSAAKENLAIKHELHKQGSVNRSMLNEARMKVEGIQTDLSLVKRQMTLQIGPPTARFVDVTPPQPGAPAPEPAGPSGPSTRPTGVVAVPTPPTPKRTQIDVSLDKMYSWNEADAAVAVVDMPQALSNKFSINFVVDQSLIPVLQNTKVERLALKGSMTGRQALAALADQLRVGFVIRQYGIFVVSGGTETRYGQDVIPEPRNTRTTLRGGRRTGR